MNEGGIGQFRRFGYKTGRHSNIPWAIGKQTLLWQPFWGRIVENRFTYATFIHTGIHEGFGDQNANGRHDVAMTPLYRKEIWCMSFGLVTRKFTRLGCILKAQDDAQSGWHLLHDGLVQCWPPTEFIRRSEQ